MVLLPFRGTPLLPAPHYGMCAGPPNSLRPPSTAAEDETLHLKDLSQHSSYCVPTLKGSISSIESPLRQIRRVRRIWNILVTSNTLSSLPAPLSSVRHVFSPSSVSHTNALRNSWTRRQPHQNSTSTPPRYPIHLRRSIQSFQSFMKINKTSILVSSPTKVTTDG